MTFLGLGQGLVKGVKLWLAGEVSWLYMYMYKYSLYVENKSKNFWNKVSLLLQDLGLGTLFMILIMQNSKFFVAF